jgi:hypothetical protein
MFVVLEENAAPDPLDELLISDTADEQDQGEVEFSDLMDGKESDFARRVREKLNAEFDWDVRSRVMCRGGPGAHKARPVDPLIALPIQHGPKKAGAIGRRAPTKHETGILRRAASPGNFIMVTMREGQAPIYVFADGGALKNENGADFTHHDFARLKQFLVADKDSLFNGTPQRFSARRLARGDVLDGSDPVRAAEPK